MDILIIYLILFFVGQIHMVAELVCFVRIEMDIEQESAWNVAQNIVISEDLVAAAKHHLQFLAAVDRKRWLYQPRPLHWAIYRYFFN